METVERSSHLFDLGFELTHQWPIYQAYNLNRPKFENLRSRSWAKWLRKFFIIRKAQKRALQSSLSPVFSYNWEVNVSKANLSITFSKPFVINLFLLFNKNWRVDLWKHIHIMRHIETRKIITSCITSFYLWWSSMFALVYNSDRLLRFLRGGGLSRAPTICNQNFAILQYATWTMSSTTIVWIKSYPKTQIDQLQSTNPHHRKQFVMHKCIVRLEPFLVQANSVATLDPSY